MVYQVLNTLYNTKITYNNPMDNRLEILYTALENTEDFIEKMDIQSEIDDIKMSTGELLPPKPVESDFECFGCGS